VLGAFYFLQGSVEIGPQGYRKVKNVSRRPGKTGKIRVVRFSDTETVSAWWFRYGGPIAARGDTGKRKNYVVR